jgi:hypothetical protein
MSAAPKALFLLPAGKSNLCQILLGCFINCSKSAYKIFLLLSSRISKRLLLEVCSCPLTFEAPSYLGQYPLRPSITQWIVVPPSPNPIYQPCPPFRTLEVLLSLVKFLLRRNSRRTRERLVAQYQAAAPISCSIWRGQCHIQHATKHATKHARRQLREPLPQQAGFGGFNII